MVTSLARITLASPRLRKRIQLQARDQYQLYLLERSNFSGPTPWEPDNKVKCLFHFTIQLWAELHSLPGRFWPSGHQLVIYMVVFWAFTTYIPCYFVLYPWLSLHGLIPCIKYDHVTGFIWFVYIKRRIIKVLSVCYIFYSPPASSLRDINLIEWTTKTNHRPVVAISRHDKRCFVMLLTWAYFVAYWKLDPTLVHSKPPNNQIRLSGSCKNP